MKALLRQIPKVDILMNHLPEDITSKVDRLYIRKSIESTLNILRSDIMNGMVTELNFSMILDRIVDELIPIATSTLKRVVNGTGIVLHTNLGRAVISDEIISDVTSVFTHYNTLEYDVRTGRRGIRYAHIVQKICMLTGAESALVVNNNAAAVMLVLNSFSKDQEVIVSRGELVEIGGSFRVPDVMRSSGCLLKEVGTTNKTHIEDYSNAISENTGMILKVHTSNYKVVGFSETTKIDELSILAHEKGLILYEDIGSGMIHNIFKGKTHDEPLVSDSIEKGVDLVSFSGDKLFGGAQAGFIVGKKAYIDKIAKNPLLRAFRIDKFSLAIVERTLSEYLKPIDLEPSVPTIQRLNEPKEAVLNRLNLFFERYKQRLMAVDAKLTVLETITEVGGGSMPLYSLDSYALAIESKISSTLIQDRLRNFHIPIISVVSNNRNLIDFKTIFESDYSILIDGVEFALLGGNQ